MEIDKWPSTPITPAQRPVVQWMDQYGPTLHRGIVAPSSLEYQRAQQRGSAKVGKWDHMDDFCRIMQIYADSTKPKTNHAKFDIRGSHSWDDVFLAARFAEQKYQEDGRGAKHVVRKFFRVTGDYAPAVRPWIGLIPNDSYMSVLCGGLKLVLGAAAQRRDRREQILDAFNKLPDTVLKTERHLELFSDDQTLRDCVLGLQLAILEMIESMVLDLVDRSTFDRIKDALRGSVQKVSVDHTIKYCQIRMTMFEERLDLLQKAKIVHADDLVTRMEPVLLNTEAATLDIWRIAQSIPEATGSQLDATSSLGTILQDLLQYATWHSRKLTRSNFSIPRLLDCLDVATNTANDDLAIVQRGSQEIDLRSQNQARLAFQQPLFQEWLLSSRSGPMLIEGNSDRHSMERKSSLTLVTSLLVQNLQHDLSAGVIFFYCGQHTSSRDDLNGPAGLIRSLIVQTLSFNSTVDLDFVDSRVWRERLQARDLAYLCHLFREIVRQLPEIVLFCIIDGINLLEIEKWGAAPMFLVSELVNISMDDTMNATLKVLFTSPGISRVVRDVAPDFARIYVPRAAGIEGPRGLNERIFMSDARQAAIQHGRIDNAIDEESLYSGGCE